MVAAVVAVWLIGGYFVVVRPTTDQVMRADAVVVLGPITAQDRLQTALELMQRGVADTLVVSQNSAQRRWHHVSVCENPQSFRVVCFVPSPSTTLGEAQETARLSAQYGWNTVVVVTSKYHITRARLIFHRCTRDRVLMLPARGSTSFADYAYQYLYQTGAFAKLFLHPGC